MKINSNFIDQWYDCLSPMASHLTCGHRVLIDKCDLAFTIIIRRRGTYTQESAKLRMMQGMMQQKQALHDKL